MSGTNVLARAQQEQVLQESVRRHRYAVLTHYGPTGWRLYKGKFSPPVSSGGVQLSLPRYADDSQKLPDPGASIGCTFRVGHKKCMFESTVSTVETHDDDACVTLRWPSQVQQLQRRVYERCSPPDNSAIAVRFWRDEGPSNISSELRDVRHGQLEDLSAGGLRVKVSREQGLDDGTVFHCSFTPKPGKPPFLVDAVLRHRAAADQSRASLGFQFIGLEATAEGRRTLDRLARLVSHFQRGHHTKRR